VGHPTSWGDSWTATPTGSDQEIQLSYTVPDSRGAQSNVDILVGGAVNKSFSETGSHTHTIDVPNDDASFDISLRVCNEFNRCTTSGVQNVQAYGPLRDSTITTFTSTANGPAVTYQISGDTNGRPAQLVLSHGDGSTQTWNLPAGPFTVSSDPIDLGYDNSEQARVDMRDPQVQRQTATQRASGQAGAPPQAHVSISRGALCNDGGGAGQGCQQNRFDPPCTDASCGFVVLTLDTVVDEQGNAGTVSCRLSANDRPDWIGRTWTLGNGTTQINTYYGNPGAQISVSCNNGTGRNGQSATNTFSWPN
jgi:hypothetical protein